MSIKRYFATADNTITNAYKMNLKTRGTGSNMGESDVLEAFSIYGHASSNSVEKARVLLDFPISKIKTDRDANVIPQSGSVKFFLRVFNAEHGQTLPKNCDLAILPLSRSFTEGHGLDMEEYSDEAVSNWVFANTTKVPAITDIKFVSDTKGNYSDKYFQIYDHQNTRYNFWFKDSGGDSAPSLVGAEIEVPLTAAAVDTAAEFALELKRSVNNASINMTATVAEADTGDSSLKTVRITNSSVGGTSGSFLPGVHLDNDVFTLTRVQRGGNTRWTTEGGDYHEVGYTAGKNLPHYKQHLSTGVEDVCVNITALVEEWLVAESTVDPDREAYGVMIKMSGSYEDGTRQRSYYTKKFFARGSEYFFKRPYIEARYDDSTGDDRSNFYKSSSLATGPENLNTLYVHNYTRNGLSNIPALKTAQDGSDQVTGEHLMKVSLYKELDTNAAPLTLPVGGGVTDNNATFAWAYLKETGIYSASLAYTGSQTKVYDVWSTSNDVQLFTGSAINVKNFRPLVHSNAEQSYVLSIKNLKPYYRVKDKPTLRLNVRKKDQQPNIYSVASKQISGEVLYNTYYRVYRVVDDTEVISYGSGSVPHTKMSYDSSGSYFKLDMSLFEPGYMYAIEVSTDSYGANIVNEDEFKFRVED